jgi:hypothetical protein
MEQEPKSWGGAMWQSANKDPRTKTYRKNFTPKARVYHYAVDNVINKQRHDVLDFGAGKHNYWADKLGREGYSCDGYDLSLTDRTMRDAYDVIMVSNVLNVQETRIQLRETLKQIMCFSKPGTIVVWNYAETPRKMPTLTNHDMEWLMEFQGQQSKDYVVLTKEVQKNLYVTTLI